MTNWREILQRRSVQRIERENREQVDTIIKLCNLLSLPNMSEFFEENGFDHFSVYEGVEKLFEILCKRESGIPNAHQRVLELQLILKEKQNEYDSLAEKIVIYDQMVKKCEQNLDKLAEEKAQLLEALPKQTNHDSTFSLSQLEDQIQAREDETNLGEDQIRKETYAEAHAILLERHDLAKRLHNELEELHRRASDGGNPLLDIIRKNELIIEDLKANLQVANNQIASLRADNEILRRAKSM
jgi:hypothetical protein